VEIDPAVINLSDVETFYDEKRPFFIEGSSIFNFGYGGARNYFTVEELADNPKAVYLMILNLQNILPALIFLQPES
jgi:hypothetical protein